MLAATEGVAGTPALTTAVEGQSPLLPPDARIWIGSLATSGELTGQWIDAAQEPEALHAAVLDTLARSPVPGAEEWGIFDYEGFGDGKIDEYEQLETVSKLAKGIEEHGPAFAAWANYLGPNQLDQLDGFEEHYRGEWPSLRAYVESYLDDIGFEHDLGQALRELPESLSRNVALDVEAVADEWENDYHVVASARGVWIFNN